MDVKTMKRVDKSLPFKDRIAFLKYCADLYETNGMSKLSDAEYDVEYYELEAIDPNDDFFEQVGGMADQHIYGTQVTHDVIMGSLSKSLDVPSFDKWIRATYKKPYSYILQHKIDGLSLGLVYDDGKLIRAVTRGDGTIGIDVTKNAVYVRGVLSQIPHKGKVEIRGECFKDRQDFYKKWHTSVGGSYANPRNFASGSINQIDPLVTKDRGLDFIGYEVVQTDFDTEVEKNRFLVRMGFNTLEASTRRTKDTLSFDKVVKAVSRYMDEIDRDKLPYDIDGVVVKLNDISIRTKMGSTAGGRKPKANRAVKFPPEEKETIFLKVEEATGRTGVITPVAILKPVELGGAMITRASLYNYGHLVGKDAIKIGATVIVAKKGDIIPQIVKIKKNGTQDVPIPSVCPSCQEPVDWDASKIEIVCNNINCLAQLNKKIEHWFKKIGVKGIAGGKISKLTNAAVLSWDGRAIVETLPEIYYMLDNDRKTEHPFRKYDRIKEFFGEKSYQNMLEAIKKVDEVALPTFIEGLGIGKVGRTAADIVAIAPTIDDIHALTVEDVEEIDGFAGKKAQGFVDGWKAQRDEIKQLTKYVKVIAPKVSGNKLVGKSFCFTGSFDSPTRGEMEKMVPENGGKLSSVSKGLTALIWDGETMKGKYDKAQKLGVQIMSQDEFLKIV